MTGRDGGWRGGSRAALLAASSLLYRALLVAYPKAFRRRYSSEMRRDFGDLLREGLEEGGARELARVWAAAFWDLTVTALKERSTMLARNAYLPVEPRIVARWGALCALLGGFLGTAFSVAFTLAINNGTPDGAAWWDAPFIGQIHFVATFLSVLGMFSLYGALVARSGGLDRLALAGAALAALSAVSILAVHAYASAMMLGWLMPGIGSHSWWLMNMQLVFGALGIGSCAVGLSLLGVSAFRMRLFGSLSALPFVVATLWPVSIALLILMNTSGIHWMHYVSWLSGTLPFLGAALSGWVLLRTTSTDQLATAGGASSGLSDETRGTARRAARAVGRTTSEGWMKRQRASAAEAAKEQELLEAIRYKGQVTAMGAALETSLSVEEAEQMLSELAAKGHLDVRVSSGRLLYALWQPDVLE